MDAQLYYTPPSDEEFGELKIASMRLWFSIAQTVDYAEEKILRVHELRNVSDNFMVMVAMFDLPNQTRLAKNLSPATRKAVAERMIDGGSPSWANPFLE